MSYYRVIPRDLFNEAKLLKCMGRLALLVHDEAEPFYRGEIMIGYDGDDFQVYQDDSDGGLVLENMKVSIHGHYVTLKTSYNSKANYPLYVEWEDDDARVFDEDGAYSEDFLEFCGRLKFLNDHIKVVHIGDQS